MTSPRTTQQAFADAAASMVAAQPSLDVLARLVEDAAEVLGARAVAILAVGDRGRFDLLASSSSTAAQLELLQAQDREGPCVDVVHTGRRVWVSGAQEMAQRWGEVGRAFLEHGLGAVDAVPLSWDGRTLGGLNVFYGAASSPWPGPELAQAFADVATIVLVHSAPVPEQEVTARVRDAVASRDVIEQAKGALAYLEDLGIAEAAGRLSQIAEDDGVSLIETANDILARAAAPRAPDTT